jgi:hypothetical protein
MKISEKVTVIIGSGGSGKTTAAKCIAKDYDADKVVWIDGNWRMNPFYYTRCNKDTELVIIEELKDINDLWRIINSATDGLCAEKRGEDPFYINPKIVVTCRPDITFKDLPMDSLAFKRRVMIVDCDLPF